MECKNCHKKSSAKYSFKCRGKMLIMSIEILNSVLEIFICFEILMADAF